jgi:hypothetical protein
MLPSHQRALRDITNCRTEALGGQIYLCPKCEKFLYSYHSCKNRHCPKCGNDQASGWLAQHIDQLLPVPHFLVTFTLPDPLRKLARSHQKIMYEILMTAACRSLESLAWNHKWIGGLIGSVAVLQTWTRDLRYHPHVHVIVTGGGLSADGKQWMPAKNDFLLPSPALAKVFRGKFRHQLSRHDFYKNVPYSAWSTDWVVDIRPVGSGQSAFRYLAPYIFRVALSNKRILSCKDGKVTFVYKDSDSSNATFKRVTLAAEDFIHRFLQHVLPLRFRKVRHYGLFSPHKKHLLQKTIQLFHCPTPKPKPDRQQLPAKTLLCPDCDLPMILVQILQPTERLPLASRSP